MNERDAAKNAAAWQIGTDGALYPTKDAADKHIAGWALKGKVCGPARPLYAATADMALVPREPTPEMRLAGVSARWASAVRSGDNVDEIYRAMLAAFEAAARV